MGSKAQSFRDKWEKHIGLPLRRCCERILKFLMDHPAQRWDGMHAYLANKTHILDGGCCSGRVTALLRKHAPESAEITSIDFVAAQNLDGGGSARHALSPKGRAW